MTGEIRSVQNADKIAVEAARLGYEKMILPRKNGDKIGGKLDRTGFRLIGVKNIYEAIDGFKGEEN